MSILTILGWILFGFIVGLIARMLLPGRQDMGLLPTILLGVVGSVIGGLVAWAFRGLPQDGFDPAGFLMSVLGAIVALAIYANVAKRRHIT